MTDKENRNVFDFLISDEKDVLLIIHSKETPPEEPAVVLVPELNRVEFFRDGETHLTLEGVEPDVFAALKDKSEVMVCEVEPTENPDETEIVYNYYAVIVKNNNE